MERLYVLERARDHKRVEFFSELRGGKVTYIIREAGGPSQDSVTTDPEVVQGFREGLLAQGYMELPLLGGKAG